MLVSLPSIASVSPTNVPANVRVCAEPDRVRRYGKVASHVGDATTPGSTGDAWRCKSREDSLQRNCLWECNFGASDFNLSWRINRPAAAPSKLSRGPDVREFPVPCEY